MTQERADAGGSASGPVSPYERAAFERLQKKLDKAQSTRSLVPKAVRDRAGELADRASDRWADLPISDSVEELFAKAFDGLKGLVIDPSLKSVNRKRVMAAFGRAGHPVDDLTSIRTMDLAIVDKVKPRLRHIYSLAGAAEGAAAGLAITRGELEGVFSAGAGAAPGAGVIIGAMAADAVSILALSVRVVAHVGAYYGYDVRSPEEEAFALSVINWSTAGEGTKALAFAQLSRLTQQLARTAAWRELDRHAIVAVLKKLYTSIGVRLTKAKLGQAVPVIGIVVGSGLNARLLERVARDAETAYRLRFLAERGLSTASAEAEAAEADDGDGLLRILEEATAIAAPPEGSQG